MRYKSTKTYGHEVGLSCAFRQWRADSHCKLLHGYALSVKLEFSSEQLDPRNWVVDFGGLKEVKQWLQEVFDHTVVISEDDPMRSEFMYIQGMGLAKVVVLPAVGCEKFAEHIYWHVHGWLAQKGIAANVQLDSVEVREHGANSAIFARE